VHRKFKIKDAKWCIHTLFEDAERKNSINYISHVYTHKFENKNYN